MKRSLTLNVTAGANGNGVACPVLNFADPWVEVDGTFVCGVAVEVKNNDAANWKRVQKVTAPSVISIPAEFDRVRIVIEDYVSGQATATLRGMMAS